MAKFILQIGGISKEGVKIDAGNAKKIVLDIRDALRAHGIEANVIIEAPPKILD